MKTLLYFYILVSAFSNTGFAYSKTYEAKITEVLKGDTFVFTDRNGNAGYLYLVAVDCPELNQEGGLNSKQFSESKILGKTVVVDEVEREGNKVYAFVRAAFGERDLGSQLLMSGNAWYDEDEADRLSVSKKSSYSVLFDAARAKKVGIWRSGSFMRFNAVNPKSFRALERDKLDQQRVNGAEDPKYSGFGRRRHHQIPASLIGE